jgi:hypothetical protein
MVSFNTVVIAKKKLFIVKKLNKSGNWDTISLYDENGSFRGEAKFSTKKEAEAYLELYKDRINKHLNAAGKAKTRLKLQVFEMDGKSMIEEKKRKYGHYHHISAIS